MTRFNGLPDKERNYTLQLIMYTHTHMHTIIHSYVFTAVV
jgi:hypothetical protein